MARSLAQHHDWCDGVHREERGERGIVEVGDVAESHDAGCIHHPIKWCHRCKGGGEGRVISCIGKRVLRHAGTIKTSVVAHDRRYSRAGCGKVCRDSCPKHARRTNNHDVRTGKCSSHGGSDDLANTTNLVE